MASSDPPLTSRLDNAGTLLQSVSTSIVQEKITIVRVLRRHPPSDPDPHQLYLVTVGWDTADLHQLPGHEPDYSACTFCLANEDHTLGNALRWIIMKE
jgi:DNA-directed RNA polymerase I and III subunit RPAC2